MILLDTYIGNCKQNKLNTVWVLGVERKEIFVGGCGEFRDTP